MNPSTTSSLEEFINAKPNDELNHYNLSIIEYFNGIEFPISELIDDYWDEIMDSAELFKLNVDQYYLYRFNPQKLSYDIYGSTCFDYIILKLNDVIQEYDFDKKILVLISKNKLLNILSRIYTAETDYLTINRKNVKLQEATI